MGYGWTGPLALISTKRQSALEKYSFNPFAVCCNPLKGKVIKYAYTHLEPVTFLDPKSNGTKQIGIDIDLIRELSLILGFKYQLIKGGPAFKLMGQWFGTYGLLIRNKVHIGSPQGMVGDRKVAGVESSTYVYHDKFVFSTRIPIPLRYTESDF